MLPPECHNRIYNAFDDHSPGGQCGAAFAGYLAHYLEVGELVDHHVDLGDAPGRANTGEKFLTLVTSVMVGGYCIDGADALQAGGTEQVLGGAVKASSTLGTFLRSFGCGHVCHWIEQAGIYRTGSGRLGDCPLTIDLDSTICETYILAKEGARHHNYAGRRGYHPLLTIAAGTDDVLMSSLRRGRANTARGAAHFMRETVSRVRYAGAKGQLTVWAVYGFYTHGIMAVCRRMKVRFSITIRQHQSVSNLIEAIPETDWTPIPTGRRHCRRGGNHVCLL